MPLFAAGCSGQGCTADLFAVAGERRACSRALAGRAEGDFAFAVVAWTLGDGEGAGRITAGNSGAKSTKTTRSARCWGRTCRVLDIASAGRKY